MAELTPDLIADLRKKSDEAAARNLQPGDDGVHVVEVDPLDMRSLLDRIAALERQVTGQRKAISAMTVEYDELREALRDA